MTAADRAHASRRRRPARRTSDPFGRRASGHRLRFALLVATAGVFTALLAVDLWNLRGHLWPGWAPQTGIPVRDNPRAEGNIAADVSGVDARADDASATDAPAADALAADALAADEPATDEPATEASVSGASVAEASARAPVAKTPLTKAPPKPAPPPKPARDSRTDVAAAQLPDAASVPNKLAPVRFVIPQPGARLEFAPSGELSERLVQAARRGERIVIRGRLGQETAPAGEQDAAARAERARRFLIVRGVPAERIWIGASVRAGDGDRALIIDVSTRGDVSDDAVLATAPTRDLTSPGLPARGPRE